MFFIVIQFEMVLDFLMAYSLTLGLFWSVLLNLQRLRDFWGILWWLISNLIQFWSDSIFCVISVLRSLLKLILWPVRIVSSIDFLFMSPLFFFFWWLFNNHDYLHHNLYLRISYCFRNNIRASVCLSLPPSCLSCMLSCSLTRLWNPQYIVISSLSNQQSTHTHTQTYTYTCMYILAYLFFW